jgi:hypothetical protein
MPIGGIAISSERPHGISNKQFLHAIYGEDLKSVHLAAVPGDPNSADVRGFWRGGPYQKVISLCLDQNNNFHSTSLIAPEVGRRMDKHFGGQKLIVIDDVGQKVSAELVRKMLGEPSYIIETSPGCFQWGYILKDKITDRRVGKALMEGLKAHKLSDPGTTKTGQYFRLPVGINGKQKYLADHPGGFPVVLREWNPDRAFAVDQLAMQLGVSLTEDDLVATSTRSVSSVQGQVDMNNPDLWVQALQELGLAKGLNSAGMLEITCPFVEEHTGQVDNGSAYLGNERFKCHHRCDCRDSLDFHARIKEMLADADPFGGSGEGWMARQRFKCEPIDQAQVEQVKQTLEQSKLDRLNDFLDRYVYIVGTERFLDTQTGALLSASQFAAVNSDLIPVGLKGEKSAPNVFLNAGGRRVMRQTYRPGAGLLMSEHNEFGVSVPAVNNWRPPRFKPAPSTDADIKVWLDHASLVLPDASEREFILDWMAIILQHPGIKINFAPLLIGAQGIGKDSLFVPVLRAVGGHNVSTIDPTQLESPFNGWIQRQLIVVEEMAATDRTWLHERMKRFLVAPPDTVPVNEKNVKQYEIPNIQCWLMFSNHEDAVPVSDDDRRFWVYISPAKRPDPSYFAALYTFYGEPSQDGSGKTGAEKIAGWLMQRDVSKFDPKAAPPWTTSKTRVARAALPAAGRWVLDEVESGRFAGRKLVTVKEFVDAAASRSPGIPDIVARSITNKHVERALRTAGAKRVREIRATNQERITPWALERADLYAQMSADQLRDAYEHDRRPASPFAAVG